MKKILLMVIMCVIALAASAQTNDCVEVIYFHGKQRCPTCMAIEKHAREVVEHD